MRPRSSPPRWPRARGLRSRPDAGGHRARTSGMLASSVATPPTASATRGLVDVADVADQRRTDGRAAEEGDGVERHDTAPHGGVGPELQGGVVGGHEARCCRRPWGPAGRWRPAWWAPAPRPGWPRRRRARCRRAARVDGRLRKAVARPPTTAPAPMATMNAAVETGPAVEGELGQERQRHREVEGEDADDRPWRRAGPAGRAWTRRSAAPRAPGPWPAPRPAGGTAPTARIMASATITAT